MPAIFITFEGIDGSGKSTQLQKLSAYLTTHGLSHLITREPGGTAIGTQIRQVVLDNDNVRLAATTELLLYAADRAQHVEEVLRPALTAQQVVLCDRYTDATLAYQGYGRGLSLALLEGLNQVATTGLTPDITLLFDLDVESAQTRLMTKTGTKADRLDTETKDFHLRVREGYLALATRFATRFKVIDATLPLEETFWQVKTAITPLLKL